MVNHRVVFLGTPNFAVPSLRALLHSPYEVCAVFTQPDRPAGRGQRLQPPPIKSLAEERGIPVFQPLKIRSEENKPIFEKFKPEFIVAVAFGQIIPPWILNICRIAPVNVHPSLLPKYRGAAPLVWPIYNGDSFTGVTTMLMDEHLDTGPILLKQEYPLPESMTCGELESTLAEIGADLLLRTLSGLIMDSVRPVPQNEAEATFAPRIKKEMARIDWKHDARKIHNMVRAFNPWPLAFSEYQREKLQILKTNLVPLNGGQNPGTFSGFTQSGILIQCGKGTVLEIQGVKPANRRPMSGREFGVGARLKTDIQLFNCS
jgi:methionyl-tRNA formyltransferase